MELTQSRQQIPAPSQSFAARSTGREPPHEILQRCGFPDYVQTKQPLTVTIRIVATLVVFGGPRLPSHLPQTRPDAPSPAVVTDPLPLFSLPFLSLPLA